MKTKIYEKKSPYQKIEIFKKEGMGKSLYINNIEQFSEFDEHKYHETMAGVPLAIHPKPNNILIIGGGDGGIVRECLKNNSVESIDLCEIDEYVINICKKHFPQITKSLENPKVNIFNEDGSVFLKKTKKDYDIIIVDSTDPNETSNGLFSKDFYKDLNLVSNNQTISVLQFEGCFFNNTTLNRVLSSIYETFNFVDFFRCEYDRGDKNKYVTFAICSRSNFSRPINMLDLFEFNGSNYKKIRNFKNKINWLKNK
jgi:spermidine synthase